MTNAEEVIGLDVPPQDVRLITKHNDAYKWVSVHGKEHLFAKNLSKLSPKAYRELCEGVGQWFEAVPADTVVGSNSTHGNSSPDRTFSMIIRALEADKASLEDEVQKLKVHASGVEINSLHLQQELQMSQVQNHTLHDEITVLKRELDSIKQAASLCVSKVWQIVQEYGDLALSEEESCGVV